MFVKICGITSEQDALLAVACGADAVGFVFAPSKRQVSPGRVAEIVRRLPPEILTVGVFRDELPERVIALVGRAGLQAAQLHGDETPAAVAAVRREVRTVFKAVVAGSDAFAHAASYGADAVLVDAPNPGSGRMFDWRLAEDAPAGVPLIMAGGLHPGNVADAIAKVEPWGVDVFVILPTLSRGLRDQPQVPDWSGFAASPLAEVLSSMEQIGAVYAPTYRALPPVAFRNNVDPVTKAAVFAAADADIKAAFEAYLENDNRGRAILFMSIGETQTLLQSLEERVRTNMPLVSRTVGFVALTPVDFLSTGILQPAACMEGVGRPCLIVHNYRPGSGSVIGTILPSSPLSPLPDADTLLPDPVRIALRDRALAASEWLDLNTPKPAPPLPEMETIEVAPIMKPGPASVD